ncbi:aminopeptidase P family protein [Siccibacter turicensis]|uniref:aminopeptidase P family protein n=1 Tax=Siccibacter turicensis TaxID=357233 RepID=UPI0004670AC9|nr:aminopeptidase P family protein [Siccibacter turicensis]
MQPTTPLGALRALMQTRGLDGLLVPRADAHQSEDCAPHDNKLAWLTGFTGSAGLALVLADRALLFVDGRYQVQVQHEVDTRAFEIHHLHNEPVTQWIAEHLAPGARIGFEPLLMVNSQYEALCASRCEPVALDSDPFDAVWHDRPAAPCGAITAMPLEISGESSADKRQRVAQALRDAAVDYLAITLPDNIAWLLNVRGSDVAMSPVPHSFLLIDQQGDTEWFVAPEKLASLDPAAIAGVMISPPQAFVGRVAERAAGRVVALDADFSPVALRFAVEAAGGTVRWQSDPVTWMKALKNPVELEGYRASHREDGAAWVNFLAWLQREVPRREAAGDPITELEAQEKQLEFRQQRASFIEPSFTTISAAGSNAAMCHYHSSPETNRPITRGEFYLNDSGGQYLNGTTDATRTLSFGPLDAPRRLHYTAVLKGFLALITLPFPNGTQGHQLDAVARRPLWELGLDFDHGTGHGVGHRMLIHELPQRIAKKVNPWPLLPGSIMTIEPGYYLAEQYGIRIENQVEVVKAAPGFSRFSTLTLIPIDLSQVEIGLLSEQEKVWLDDYHQQVRETLSPLVDEDARAWLFAATASLRVQTGA